MGNTIVDPHRLSLWQRSTEFDAKLDAAGLASLWHPEGRVQIGAMPPVSGRENIQGFFTGFFAAKLFETMRHELAEVWDMPDVLIYRATVIYTLASGEELPVPYVNVVRYRDGLFADYRVFVDTQPLMSSAAAHAA